MGSTMGNIDEVAENTYRMELLIPGIDTLFAVYFIRDEKGVLLEPGPTSAIPFIQQAMGHLGMKDLAYIIPTHIHMDHAGALGSLAQLFPRAKVLLHPRGAKHVIDPSRLIESTRMAFGDDFEDLYGPILPVSESQVKIPEDGEKISLTERELQIVYSPGHAPHHLAVFDCKTKGIFSGEALGLPLPGAKLSPLPAAAPPSFNQEEYLESMEKLKRLHPQIIFYSHDGVGKNPDQLISQAEKNTKIVGHIILNTLREGHDTEAVRARLQESIGAFDEMALMGFVHYFQKNRLFQE
jgi:glyoxylase-like metal-dependent hydrolase (beta-lactamase superfamily II)